ASVAVQQSARQLSQLKTQGLAISDDWLSDYSTMGGALSVAARFSSRGSFDETRIALQMFAAELASTFPTTPDAAHPQVGATFATARDEALTSADIAGLLANLLGDGRVARQLAAVAAQLDQGPDGLERTADSFLAFDDPSLRHALGLDDPLVAGGLQNIRVL